MSAVPAGGGSIAARFVAIDALRQLSPGEIVWDRGGRIVALRRPRGRHADVCVLPGLVDAHAHLQIAALPRPCRPFAAWVDAVMAARRTTAAAAERATTAAAIADLVATGTTAVGDIDATGRAAAALRRSGLVGRSYRELTGFHLDEAAARRLVRSRSRPGASPVTAGLSPHAPYSVSPALFRAAARACRHLAIHCAETPDEQRFLHSGSGPFRDLLARLGRLPAAFQAPGCGAVRWLLALGVLRTTTQLVHCQELERGDAALIADAGASVVVCPGTIEYFDRPPPPVPAWLRRGIPVALGTDSRASNTVLSMRVELQRAAAAWPTLAPASLLAMATSAGGRALGLPAAGTLTRRGRADFVVVPAAATFAATLAAFVHGESPLQRVVCGGRDRLPDGRGR